MLSTQGGNSKGDTGDIENYDADKEVNMNMLILQILPPTQITAEQHWPGKKAMITAREINDCLAKYIDIFYQI